MVRKAVASFDSLWLCTGMSGPSGIHIFPYGKTDTFSDNFQMPELLLRTAESKFIGTRIQVRAHEARKHLE